MNNSVVTNQVLVLFLVMMVGFFTRRRQIITPVVSKGLTNLLLKVTCPMAIYISFNFTYSSSMLAAAGQVLAFTIVLNCCSILLGLVLFKRYQEQTRQVLRFVTLFSNCGFMAIRFSKLFTEKLVFFRFNLQPWF